jgi:hypothetical protein
MYEPNSDCQNDGPTPMGMRHEGYIILAWLLGLIAIGVGTGLLVTLVYSMNGKDINSAIPVGSGFAVAFIVATGRLIKKFRLR